MLHRPTRPAPLLTSLALALSLGAFSACTESEGPAERAGENLDEAADEAGDAMEDIVD